MNSSWASPLSTGPDCEYEPLAHFKQAVTVKLVIDLGEVKRNPGISAEQFMGQIWTTE